MGHTIDRILICHTITREDIENLFAGKILGICVPGLISENNLKKAKETIPELLSQGSRWYLDKESQIVSDMGYLLAIPRHRAMLEEQLVPDYIAAAREFESRLQGLFPDVASPITTLQSLFEKAYGHKIEVEKFGNSPGLPAILRYMIPENFFPDCPDGVCHIDYTKGYNLLSANLYLTLPSEGGEIQLWDFNVKNQPNHFISRLLHHRAFEAGYRDRIQLLLPKPLVIRPNPGDLFLFDAGKPHAVRSFSEGVRTSLQTFLKINEADPRDVTFSS